MAEECSEIIKDLGMNETETSSELQTLLNEAMTSSIPSQCDRVTSSDQHEQTAQVTSHPQTESETSMPMEKEQINGKDAAQGTGSIRIIVENLTKSDVLRLRFQFLEVVEELKIRRATDLENEEKIQQLMQKIHTLKSENEDCLDKIKKQQLEQEEQLSSIKKKHQHELKDREEVKEKLKLSLENIEKETTNFKNDIRCLQMSKYNLEKTVKDQERVLQMKDTIRDTRLAQLSALEHTCKTTATRMEQLTKDHDRLSKNVTVATEMNRDLAYLVQHHNCEARDFRKKISELQQTLTETRLQLNAQPLQSQDLLKDKDDQISELFLKLKLCESNEVSLKKDLADTKQQYKKQEEQLKELNKLLSRHVKSVNQKSEESTSLQASLSRLTETHTKLQHSYDTLVHDLETEKSDHAATLKQCNAEEESLSSRLKTLQGDHEALSKAHNNLEELNTKWAMKNTALTQDITRLKEQLNTPRSEVGMQTEGVVVEEVSCQAVPYLTVSASQTELVKITDRECQTNTGYPENYVLHKMKENSPCKELEDIPDRGVVSHEVSCTVVSSSQPVSSSPSDPGPMPLTEHTPSGQDPPQIETVPSGANTHPSSGQELNTWTELEQLSPDMAEDFDDKGSYKRFTSTLKTIASMFKPYHNKPERTELELNEEPSLKKQKLPDSHEIPESPSATMPRSSFQLGQTDSQAAAHPLTSETNAALSNSSAVSGILSGACATRSTSKRVSFAQQLEHHSDWVDSSTPQTAGSRLTRSARKFQQHTHDTPAAMNEEQSLFSEDEVDTFELGSQVDKISTFLKIDKLHLSKQ